MLTNSKKLVSFQIFAKQNAGIALQLDLGTCRERRMQGKSFIWTLVELLPFVLKRPYVANPFASAAQGAPMQ